MRLKPLTQVASKCLLLLSIWSYNNLRGVPEQVVKGSSTTAMCGIPHTCNGQIAMVGEFIFISKYVSKKPLAAIRTVIICLFLLD